MALTTMYPAINGSPKTTLEEAITAGATSMTLADAGMLPAAPNLAVIGTTSTAEIVRYTSKLGNVVSGLTRGMNGTVAQSWGKGAYVARNFTALDHDTFKGNIEELDLRKADASSVYTKTETDTLISLIPYASTTSKGEIKVGDNLSIDSNGFLSATDTIYSEATEEAAGLMSAEDKGKLDGIAVGANKYTLPTATASKLGGIKVGANLTISSGILSAVDTTYNNATTSSAGLMSASDKVKLNSIADNANNYSLPTASSNVLGGVKVGENLSIDNNGVLSSTDTTYNVATTTTAGLMSASDKTKLNGISNATTTKAGLMSAADKVKLDSIQNATTTNAGLLSASDKVKLDGMGGIQVRPDYIISTTDIQEGDSLAAGKIYIYYESE